MQGFEWLIVLAFLAVVVGVIVGVTKLVKAAALPSGSARCPHCAEPIRAEASVCRYCGRDI